MLVWDEQSLLNRCRNQSDRVRYLIEIFLQEAPTQVAALETHLRDGDMPGLKNVAHSIKGMSANLGGLDLQKAAARLEKSATDQEADTLRDLKSVLAAYQELELELTEYLNEF